MANAVPSVRAIDIETDHLIDTVEAGDHCPGPRKPCRATTFRWMLHGVRVPGTEERVKLPYVKLNGRRLTSVESLRSFLLISSGQAMQQALSPSQRRRQAVAAGDALAAAGM